MAGSMKNTLLLILASIFLAGCSARAAETVVPAAGTPSQSAPLPVTERPSATSTWEPTSTLEPTQTPDPVIATGEAALNSCRGNSQGNIDQFITRAYSATTFWSATVCQDDGIYTKVTRLGNEKVYKIPALDTDATTPGPDWFWEPYLWSVEDDFLYLTPRYLGFIDSPRLIYSAGFGLVQLDLSSGDRNVLLKPYEGGYTFALSEDGRLFAYLPDIPRTINLLDLKTKEKKQLSFKESYKILEMRWTPDGARLLVLAEELANDRAQGGFSIFEYSLEGDDLKKLVDKNNLNSIYSSDPSDEPRIYISNLTNDFLSLADTLQEAYFQVDLRTGEVIQTSDSGIPTASP